MSALLWLIVPLAPLAGLIPLLRQQWRPEGWFWLTCLPALVLAFWPPAALPLPGLWPGTQWGADDILARVLLAFSALLWGCASLYAARSQRDDDNRRRFWAFWLLSLSGNLMLVIAQDGASFYVGFTLMSLSAYGLVVHLGGPGPRQAGRIYLQLAVLGEMLLYAGLIMRVHEAGGLLSFADWQAVPVGGVTAALLLIGFGLKAGFWPLHVWLPLAHPAAPAAASAVLSGAMIKAGILGMWRFLPDADPGLQHLAPTVFVVGLFSAFFGVALGLIQRKPKAALAYSSVSQMGYLLAILALAWLKPEDRAFWGTLLAFYIVHHGFAKGALFMGAGLASSYRLKTALWIALIIPALALAGLPLTSGGVVKTLFKDALSETALSHWLFLLSLGSLATTLLLSRALWLMWRGNNRLLPQQSPPRQMRWPWLLLCLLPITLPWCWPEMHLILLGSLSLYAIGSLLWPLLIALVITAAVLKSGWQLPPHLARLPNPSLHLALWLKHWLQRPPLPSVEPDIKPKVWRARERHWNRFWQQGAVAITAWLLCLLLLLGWAW